ncbi:MAG: TrlF family AAA-like ATPase [Solirubrobacteraceae bacterium]
MPSDPTSTPAPSRGARYFRADLQVHTPADKHWPGAEPTDPDERAALALKYLQAAKDHGIELVGITEHHDVSWIDELRHAASRLHMRLLPGFEVETQEGIHVLCLFDLKTPVWRLEETLALVGLSRARRDAAKSTEIRSELPFGDLIRKVQEDCDGICIAAHVTSTKGVLSTLQGGARADCWKTPELLATHVPVAVEKITHDGTKRILANEDDHFRRERRLAYVLTSDARDPDSIGTASVWIKMQEPSVEGLRQAFLDPDSRISFEDPHAARVAGEILSIGWEGGFLDGQSIGLSPELSCLIGSKGTGKSTVIESLRWAFDLPSPPPGDASDLLANAIRPGSKVMVRLRTSAPAASHTIERTMPHAPVVRDAIGVVVPELAPRSLLTLRVFSQKQLYDTAQSVQGRLELVDEFAREALSDIRTAERKLLGSLEAGARALREELGRIDHWEEQLAELPGLEQWRRRFAEAGFEDRLRERRALDREQARLTALDAAVLQRLRGLDRLREETPPPTVAQAAAEWPNLDLLGDAENAVNAATTAFAVAIDALHDDLAAARERLAATQAAWSARRAARQADFDAALRALQTSMPEVDPERYLDVERRIEALIPLQGELRASRQRVLQARAARRGSIAELADLRARRFRARDAAAEQLTRATDGDVRVRVRYQADRSGLLDSLRRRKTGVRNAALEAMISHPDFTPAELARRVRERQVTGSFGLPDGQAATLERELTEDDLLAIEIEDLCDEATVELDVGPAGSKMYRPLSELSPGQKSTAVLLLTLLSGSEPLLIDQPEDDLDNRFVYDDVVQRLRSAKRRRQLLVATHNANIPVLGDAEQIVVLDAVPSDPARGEVRAHGPIDDREVRTAAEQILEGGETAFRRRREKYGW